jgi:hypothetical protein
LPFLKGERGIFVYDFSGLWPKFVGFEGGVSELDVMRRGIVRSLHLDIL